MTDPDLRIALIEARMENPTYSWAYEMRQDVAYLLAELRDRDEKLAKVAADIDGELQDAPPSNYEEDNYDAGYIAGLAYAQAQLAEAWEQGRDAEFQRSVMKRQTDPNPYRAAVAAANGGGE